MQFITNSEIRAGSFHDASGIIQMRFSRRLRGDRLKLLDLLLSVIEEKNTSLFALVDCCVSIYYIY